MGGTQGLEYAKYLLGQVLIKVKIILLYACVCIAQQMSTCCLGGQGGWQSFWVWASRSLWAEKCVLGTKPWSSAGPSSAFTCWDTGPDESMVVTVFRLYTSLKVSYIFAIIVKENFDSVTEILIPWVEDKVSQVPDNIFLLWRQNTLLTPRPGTHGTPDF